MEPMRGARSDVPTPLLSRDAIAVWRISTAVGEGGAALRPLLAAEERERADRMPDPTARARFVATRASLRTLLARHLGGDPATFELRYGTNGKPYLVRGGVADDLRFSVSHAGDLALVAFGIGRDIGVDIERVRQPRYVDRIAARLFDAGTCRLLEALAPDERAHVFHHAWTQREAFVKAVGGTVFATEDPLAFHWPRPHHDVQRARDGNDWTVAVLSPGAGYVGTVVAHGATVRIHEHEWDPMNGR